MPKAKAQACPKCNRLLQPSGELVVGRAVLPTYQCDECLVEVDFLGEKVEQALTFCVDGAGRVFDPAEPDGELRF